MSALLLLLLAISSPPILAAETQRQTFKDGDAVILILKGGEEISGIYRGRLKGTMRIVSEFGEIGVETARIARMKPEPDDGPVYRHRRQGIYSNDYEARWQLAQWARRKGLESVAVEEARAILAHDPSNRSVQSFLGQSTLQGESLTDDEPAKTGPLKKGYGVVLELDEGREITGIYEGEENGQYVLNIINGESYTDKSDVRRIRRIRAKVAAYTCLKNSMNDSDAEDHWRLSQWAKLRGMKREALEEAKIAAELGHEKAKQFIANPIWIDSSNYASPLYDPPAEENDPEPAHWNKRPTTGRHSRR